MKDHERPTARLTRRSDDFTDDRTALLVLDGPSRSGKGETGKALRTASEACGLSAIEVVNGLNFRAMAKAAIAEGCNPDSRLLESFIEAPSTRELMLGYLSVSSGMSPQELDAYFYTPEISSLSGRVGAIASAHTTATEILRSRVESASKDDVDVVIIDGRAMGPYAREFERDGLGRFVMSWYLKCDPAVAARRNLKLFAPIDELSPEDQLKLLRDTFNTSDRNRSDTLREVDPLKEPTYAYVLDLLGYTPEGYNLTPYARSNIIAQRHSREAMADTSYTTKVEQMTEPIVDITMFALYHAGLLGYRDMHLSIVPAA